MEELGRVTVDEAKSIAKLPVTILLDNVRSLHNVGSTFRTCDAFCIEEICLTGITGTPPHREINKTALGATESVKWRYMESSTKAVQSLKQQGFLILVIEQTTNSKALQLLDIDATKKYCLVFGNEVEGVSNDVLALADGAIEIQQGGIKHSLNIAVCVGIVAWEFFKKFRLNTT